MATKNDIFWVVIDVFGGSRVRILMMGYDGCVFWSVKKCWDINMNSTVRGA